MANVAVVGKFAYEGSDHVITIMKFSPSEPSESIEFFITDALKFVEPLREETTFIDRRGKLLFAKQS